MKAVQCRAALAFLLLAAAVPGVSAFPFFGRSDVKAETDLHGMSDAYGRGECDTVLELADPFFGEKPPSAMREEAYGYIGSCYENLGSLDKAIGLYKLALGLYPDNSLFSYRLALIYNQAGFPENAVPLFLKILGNSPDDAGANLGLARAYYTLGFLAKAGNNYSRVAVLQGFSDAGVLEEYAFCMLKKRDWEQALLIAGKGESAAPGRKVWPLIEARVRAGQGAYPAAVAALDEAVKREPSRLLRLERALYLLLGGSAQKAAEAADAELAAAPGDPLASMVKGMALYSSGRKQEAAPYFSAARSGGPFTAELAGSFLKDAAAKP